jgi:flavin reductase (DIM6/NTAB) family NADH-FMN oxidoreductase RutF
VTIHHSHPFAVGENDRKPLRRFRGRMASPVSIWAAAAGGQRAGWTLSSFLVADGDPGEVIGLIDEESPLADVLTQTATLTVNLPGWRQRKLADAFAGVAPAPGGPFTLAAWRDTDWGPVLDGSLGWIGARLNLTQIMQAGVSCSELWWSESRSNPIPLTNCCITYAAGTVPCLSSNSSVASAP